MKYLKKYLVDMSSVPTDFIIDRNKMVLYFMDSDDVYTMLYKQVNKEEEFIKIVKKQEKYNEELKENYFEYHIENCSKETFENLKNVREGKLIKKKRIVLKVEDNIIYIEDYKNMNLTIAKVIFDNEKDFKNFTKLDFLGEDISNNEKYKNIDFKLAKDLFEDKSEDK